MDYRANEKLTWIRSLAKQLAGEIDALAGEVDGQISDIACLMELTDGIIEHTNKLTLKPDPETDPEPEPVPETGAVVVGGDQEQTGEGSSPLLLTPGRGNNQETAGRQKKKRGG